MYAFLRRLVLSLIFAVLPLALIATAPLQVIAADCPLPAGLPSTGGGGCSSLLSCAQQGSVPVFVLGFLGSGLLSHFAPPEMEQAPPPGCVSSGPAPLPAPGVTPAPGPRATTARGAGGPQPAVPTPPPCPPAPPAPPLPAPERVAQRIALPWPAFTIGINPPRGLTGFVSWYWLMGYAGQPLVATRTIALPGQPNSQAGCPSGPGASELVSVRALPVSWHWTFGDRDATGAPAALDTTSVGRAYPQESSIQHEYQASSAAFRQGFPVTVAGQFQVTYRRAAGAWQPLATVVRTATVRYPVFTMEPLLGPSPR